MGGTKANVPLFPNTPIPLKIRELNLNNAGQILPVGGPAWNVNQYREWALTAVGTTHVDVFPS